jgi:hypothetical protein
MHGAFAGGRAAVPAVTPGRHVLVLGGYGSFGTIISQRLAMHGDIEVTVAGRDESRARALAQSIGARWLVLDAQDPGLAAKLGEAGIDLVISTSGPFQVRDYRVARAAIEAGAHYVDIADGRRFVTGISELDEAARRRGVLVVSGASSVPALSAAVIDRYAAEFAELHAIDFGISASERTPGLATAASVLGYCGKRFTRWRGGKWHAAHGWQGIRRHDFGAEVGSRWLCDCDIPDLGIFPQRYHAVRDVRFGAGVELAVVQWGLWLMSWAVRAGLVRDAARWARPLRRAAIAFERLGSGRSAMFVTLRGIDSGRGEREIRWRLVARDNDGAAVPCLGAVALARKILFGNLESRGAMPCAGLLDLDEYLGEVRGLNIESGTY